MKTDMPLAAVRLLSTLPVRTHIRPEVVQPSTLAMRRRRRSDFVAEDRSGRPIRFKGVEYASLNLARRALHVSRETLLKMIAQGRAEYV